MGKALFRGCRGRCDRPCWLHRVDGNRGVAPRRSTGSVGSAACSRRGSGASSPCAVGGGAAVHVQPLRLKSGVTRAADQAALCALAELFNLPVSNY